MDGILLDHCVNHVSTWQRSKRFYREGMGAVIIPIGAGFSYRFGDTQLNCHAPGVDGAPNAAWPVQPGGSDLCFI